MRGRQVGRGRCEAGGQRQVSAIGQLKYEAGEGGERQVGRGRCEAGGAREVRAIGQLNYEAGQLGVDTKFKASYTRSLRPHTLGA